MTRTAGIVLALALGACTQNSGVIPMGGGRYTVTSETDVYTGGISGAQRRASQDAQEFCAKQGRPLQVQNIATVPQGFMSYSSATLTFTCG